MTEEIKLALEDFWFWLNDNEWTIAQVSADEGLVDIGLRSENFDSLLRRFESDNYA